MSAGLIVRIMHVASSSIHYKPVTLLHRHPSPCRNHGAGHGDLVDLVTLCPSSEVVSLLDREADLHALNFVILSQATAISQKP